MGMDVFRSAVGVQLFLAFDWVSRIEGLSGPEFGILNTSTALDGRTSSTRSSFQGSMFPPMRPMGPRWISLRFSLFRTIPSRWYSR